MSMERQLLEEDEGGGNQWKWIVFAILLLSVGGFFGVGLMSKYRRQRLLAGVKMDLSQIKAKEQAYFTEFSEYLAVGKNPSVLLCGGTRAWSRKQVRWLQLGFRPAKSAQYFQFEVFAGKVLPKDPVVCDGLVDLRKHYPALLKGKAPWFVVCARGTLNAKRCADVIRFALSGSKVYSELIEVSPRKSLSR